MPEAPIRLGAGDLRLEVDARFGGRITAFWSETPAGRVDWFVPTPAETRDPATSTPSGSFPMVPFSNRIRDARFPWAGREIAIAASERGKPHAIHGYGRGRAWQVERATASEAVLSLNYAGGDWPFAFRARQSFRLDGAGLTLAMELVNTGAAPMPGGLGLHPYLPWRGGVGLAAAFETVWPAVADSIPDGASPMPAELDFAAGRALPKGLDTGFGGWAGRARISWPADGLTLDVAASAGLGHVILFTPEGRDFFCFEPVTHAIDAANLSAKGIADTGWRAIAPGETFAVEVRFSPVVGAI